MGELIDGEDRKEKKGAFVGSRMKGKLEKGENKKERWGPQEIGVRKEDARRGWQWLLGGAVIQPLLRPNMAFNRCFVHFPEPSSSFIPLCHSFFFLIFLLFINFVQGYHALSH